MLSLSFKTPKKGGGVDPLGAQFWPSSCPEMTEQFANCLLKARSGAKMKDSGMRQVEWIAFLAQLDDMII